MAFTFFFRDGETLDKAIEEALPALRGRAFIDVWDAGCAHGPEPYTLAILLREAMSDFVFRNVRIHATDVDASFAGQVAAGIFTAQEVARVPAGIRSKYFRPAATSGRVEIVPELRAKVRFSHHDLLSLRPIREGLSLVVCKNVLLHFDAAQRVQVLEMFHPALQPDGILVMEHTQKLPEHLAWGFRPACADARVYRRVERAAVGHPAEDAVPRRHQRRAAFVSGEGSPCCLEESHRAGPRAGARTI